MMRPAASIAFILILASTLALSAAADTITLKSGDRLTGALLQISSGIVSFRTQLAGRIMVPHEEVAALETSTFLVVAMRDQSALPGRIQTIDNEIVLLSADGKKTTPLNLARIQDIESLPASPEPAKESRMKDALSATVETGYKLRSGTKDSSGAKFEFGLTHEAQRITTRLNAEFEYTEDADDADRFISGDLTLISIQDSKFRPTLILEAERDRNRALDSRFEAAAGVTSKLFADKKFDLEGFAGLGGSVQDFDPDPLRSDLNRDNTIPSSASEKRQEDLNLDLRLRYTRDILQKSTLTEKLTFKPSITNPGDLRTELESSISVPLTYHLRLNFDLLFDYNNNSPYRDIDKWNTSVSAGVQVAF